MFLFFILIRLYVGMYMVILIVMCQSNLQTRRLSRSTESDLAGDHFSTQPTARQSRPTTFCNLYAVTPLPLQSYFKRRRAVSSEKTERASLRVTLEHERVEPGTLLDHHLSILRCGEQIAVR